MWKSPLIFATLLATTLSLNLPGVPTDFTANDVVLSAVSDDVARKFETEYMKFLATGVESAVLKQISTQLANSHSKKDIFIKEVNELGAVDQFFVCTTCRAVVNVIAKTLRSGDVELNSPHNKDVAKNIFLDVCKRLKFQTEEVCSELFDSHWLSAEYIIKNSEYDSRHFCSLFMQYSFCNLKNHPSYEWSLNIDNSGAAVTAPKSDIPAKSSNDMKILHLGDIHHDPLYLPGSLAECDEPLCCQRHSNIAEGTSKAAGYWGDYRQCDLPWQTADSAFNHIKDNHKIDYIFQTGDVIDHMVWGTSVEKNKEVNEKINNRLYELFPNVPVYPTLGNHEPHPLNLFSPTNVPDNVNTNWLYEFLYNCCWSKYLPADTKDTIMKGGYYTTLVKPGYRIVSLNGNDCYTSNWWLYFSGTDMKTQLMWLHDVLLAAEKAGEHVHILAHIPSGDGNCWIVWSREYSRIIARFRNTISGIFNGHSHKDETNVYYSNGHAVNIAHNGGALTTWSFRNPNYRVYQVEPQSMQVVDHETWIFNLTEANLAGESQSPRWFKEYTFSEEFTSDMSPAGIDKLLDTMADTPDLVRKFWRHKMTSTDARLAEGCDKSCLLSTICRMATTVNEQTTRCEELKAKLNIAIDIESGGVTDPTSTPTPSENPTDSTQGTTSPATPEDDGAVSITAVSLTSLLGLIMCIRYIF